MCNNDFWYEPFGEFENNTENFQKTIDNSEEKCYNKDNEKTKEVNKNDNGKL